MCRNIKTLANFAPPATDDEIRASALQFVRKLSGTTHPSHANEAAFNAAVDEVTLIARRLIDSLTLKTACLPVSPPGRATKNRDVSRSSTAYRDARLLAQICTAHSFSAWSYGLLSGLAPRSGR